MHQPYYRDPIEDTYILPWVRLHAVNAYYNLPRIASEYGNLRMTFNLVPSLIEQLEDYASGRAKDLYEHFSRIPPGGFDPPTKLFILRNFFMANWDTMIRPNGRYNDLLLKRGYTIHEGELDTAVRSFSEQDFIDLQTWFNLAWIGPKAREEDNGIGELIKKGRFFNEDEKNYVLDYHYKIIGRVLPAYKQILDSGIADISLSPFYHPILPLLFDSDIATEAHPGVKLPKRFEHPEDATAQIQLGINKLKEVFGFNPSGMWPSEGSVSMAVVEAICRAGLKWIATDEGILLKSLQGPKVREQVLYRPYLIPTQAGDAAIFFRDTRLSDLIGFTYSHSTAEAAVADFIAKLKQVAGSVPEGDAPIMVSVILDGENPWEYYPNCGRAFLELLFSTLQKEDWIKTTTFSGYLEENPPKTKIKKLAAGSWINGNFDIWIGKKEANQAWDSLGKARELLVKNLKENAEIEPSAHEEVLRSIYRGEGSDWFWWFDDDFTSENEMEFDFLFRKHLSWAFYRLNMAAPDFLNQPIKESQRAVAVRKPTDFISPVIDGEVTHFYEWANAGSYTATEPGSTMYSAQRFLKGIQFGFELKNLYLRFDLLPITGVEGTKRLEFKVHFVSVDKLLSFIWTLASAGPSEFTLGQRSGTGGQQEAKSFSSIAGKKIIELGVPFADLGLKPGDESRIYISIHQNGLELKRYPQNGFITFNVPDETFHLQTWSV